MVRTISRLKRANKCLEKSNLSACTFSDRESIRKRKMQVNFFKISKMKRKFSRICVKEGIVSDRVNCALVGTDSHNPRQQKGKYPVSKRDSNPFRKEIEISHTTKLQEKAQLEAKLSREREQKQRCAARSKKNRELSEKNTFGQPVLKHKIFQLLKRIESA